MLKNKPVSTIFLIILFVAISFVLIEDKLDVETSLIPLDKIPRMTEIESDNINKILSYNSEYPFLFLISRDTCPSCVEAFPTIAEAINNLPIDHSSFYFDTDKNRDAESFEKIIKIFDVETVPSIVIFLGDKVLGKIDNLEILMNTDKLTETIRGVY